MKKQEYCSAECSICLQACRAPSPYACCGLLLKLPAHNTAAPFTQAYFCAAARLYAASCASFNFSRPFMHIGNCALLRHYALSFAAGRLF